MGVGQGAGGDHLISITAPEAFAAYEAVRHRLPPAQAQNGTYRQIETLEDVADAFDIFLLDAFGVLNIGERPIPGVRARIDGLRAAGKRVLILSNAASVPSTDLRAKYSRLGYDFPAADIITSRATMAAQMQAAEGILWGVMLGGDMQMDDFAGRRLRILGDDPAAYAAVDGFLLVGSATWTEARQTLLEAALRDHPRRVLVANPDIVAPRETGFSAEPGHFAHRLADETGIVPEFFGKPFANIYDLAFERLGDVDPSRVLMVGDSLHTDILGAQAAGIASALVTDYGFFAGHDAAAAITSAGIVPDFVVPRP